MLKIYSSPFSTFGRRVEIALREKQIDAERVEVDMVNRDQRKQPYLALHPYGRVPTLVDGDFVLPESTPILEYLEAKYPERPLLPPGMQDRARVAMHMKLCDLELAGPSYTTIFAKRFVPQEKWRLDDMEKAKKPMARHLSVLDGQLADKPYLVADRFTLADLCYIPFMHFRSVLDVEIPANVERWAQSLLARPSAEATKPPR